MSFGFLRTFVRNHGVTHARLEKKKRANNLRRIRGQLIARNKREFVIRSERNMERGSVSFSRSLTRIVAFGDRDRVACEPGDSNGLLIELTVFPRETPVSIHTYRENERNL